MHEKPDSDGNWEKPDYLYKLAIDVPPIMRDAGTVHHAVGQAEHTYHVDIFQRIAKILASFDREATPEFHNVEKVEDLLHVPGRMIAYRSERRMTRSKMEPPG